MQMIFSGAGIDPSTGTPRHLMADFFAFEDTLRNGAFVTAGDLDGRGWKTWEETDGGVQLPRKLKVGVFAEATAPGTFKAVFDQFKLTR